MTATTPLYSIPYPEDADPAADIPDYMQAQAEQVESTIAGFGGIASPGSWTAPTLEAAFTNTGGAFAVSKYRKTGQIVTLRGVLTTSGAPAGTKVLTLPAGFRPLATESFAVAGEPGYCRVDVEVDGDVIVQTTVAGSGFLSLSGIEFHTD